MSALLAANRLFVGQVAVVTGASSGVGEAIALGLAEHGADVVLIGRHIERLQAVATRAEGHGIKARCYQTELMQDASIAEMTESLRREFEKIDLLIHSAGVFRSGNTAVAPIADFDLQYSTNLRAPYLLTQSLLPLICETRGQIVFINSSAALSAKAGVGQYAATKAGLKAVANSLRQEVARDMRVLTVFLGSTATPMQEAISEMKGREYSPEHLIQPGDAAQTVISTLALPRTVELTELVLRPLVDPNAAVV
ncbi:MAG: SDR family NAD(P)-dependent oxidoreductase [Burkholderiales bacterium]|nr:SDR family NAD(P)-dependent oxidoreductase [Burkholderiales bacterium]